MPNHWHLVVWPSRDGELSEFVGWLTLTHTQRWHAHRQTAGSGHLYQGRFKSFPVQEDAHFYAVVRYVERNALRANLVERAEDWRWCSLHRTTSITEDRSFLAPWPLAQNPSWAEYVNTPQTEEELLALRASVKRGNPYGESSWSEQAIEKLGLESTVRPRGRPRIRRT